KASRLCWARALIAVDFPALERPTKAISGNSDGGSSLSWLAVTRNRAVCVHANARLASSPSPGSTFRKGVGAAGRSSVMGKANAHCKISGFCTRTCLFHEACRSSPVLPGRGFSRHVGRQRGGASGRNGARCLRASRGRPCEGCHHLGQRVR